MNSAETLHIRLATDEDFESIFQIWLAGIGNSFDPELAATPQVQEKFTENFRQREGIFNFWVAVDPGGQIIGWQSLIKNSNNPFRANLHAESSTYIAQGTRYKGVGKMLLDYVIKEAEKSSLEYVTGFVSMTNDAARKITQETGWIEVGILPPSAKGENKFPKSFWVRPV